MTHEEQQQKKVDKNFFRLYLLNFKMHHKYLICTMENDFFR